jgi:hypothetical protein
MPSTAPRRSLAVTLAVALSAGALSAGAPAAAQPGTWTAPTPLGAATVAPDVANDRDGGALATWVDGGAQLVGRGFDPRRGTWGPPVVIGAGRGAPALSTNAVGAALVVTSIGASVAAAVRSGSNGTWGPSVSLPPTGLGAGARDGWIDDTGRGMAVWLEPDAEGRYVAVAVSRRDVDTGQWTPPVRLEEGLPAYGLGVASSPRGDGVVLVTRSNSTAPPRARVIRFEAAATAWRPEETLDDITDGAAVAMTPAADVLVATLARYPSRLVAERRNSGAVGWDAPVDLAPVAAPCGRPAIATNGRGDVIVVWCDTGLARAVRYDGNTARWDAPRVLGADAGAAGRTVGVDAAGNAVAVWLGPVPAGGLAVQAATFDVGIAQWSTPRPLSPPFDEVDPAVAALAVTADGDATVVWRQAGGVWAASWRPASTPGAPREARVVATEGSRVRLDWRPAGTGLPPTEYRIEGGLAPGDTRVAFGTGSAAPVATFDAPAGIFSVRVRAVADGRLSAASNEIRLVVGPQEPPLAPAALLRLVDQDRVLLSWTPTFGAGPPDAYILCVTGALHGCVTLPPAERVRFAGVPPGGYTVWLFAANAAGAGPASTSVAFEVPMPCAGPPLPPRRLVASAGGGHVRITWDPPSSGPAVDAYELLVEGDAVGTLPTTAREVDAVTTGTYVVRVRAVNPCGAGEPTAPTSVVAR